MSVQLVCTSHSPLMRCYAREPAAHAEVVDVFARRAAAIEAFNPQIVFVLGPDHYNGFFLKLAPPYCVGLASESVADIGGTAGKFDVPAELATRCIDALRDSGVDVAVSYAMTVDHGFSQPMDRLLGSLDRYPVVPIFVNCMIPPYVPFKRSRALGNALGKFAASLGQRVLLLASGGMSHNPTRYYPAYDDAEPAVGDWQLGGETGGSYTQQDWLGRLERMHIEGARMLAEGTRTRQDIKMNPEVDSAFLDCLIAGRLADVDEWDPTSVVERAGTGWLELHTWIAACAAYEAAGGGTPHIDIYAETLEYGIATGVVHGN